MRIDREQFLWLTAAITGCHSGAQLGEPSVIVIAAPAARGEKAAGAEDAVPEARDRGFDARCSRIAASGVEVEDDTAGYSCAAVSELCQHISEEFLPSVAEIAIACLEEQDNCNGCGAYNCAASALEGVFPGEVRECEALGPTEEGAGSDYEVDNCKRYASGMNSTGRERFALCLAENRYMGSRVCLWSGSVCAEGFSYPSYE